MRIKMNIIGAISKILHYKRTRRTKENFIFAANKPVAMFTLHKLSRDVMEQNTDRFIELLHRNLKDEYWTIDHFMTELPSKWEFSVYAHDENRHILGYAIVSEKPDSLHIHKLVVDQQVQSQGIGAAMINRLVASTDKRITLKVNTENSRAISFYKKNQFSISAQTDTSYTMTRFQLS